MFRQDRFINVLGEAEQGRASKERIRKMARYLKAKGRIFTVYMRLDAPWWYITHNDTTRRFKTNIDAYRYLYQYVSEEEEKEYQEYLKRRANKIKKELAEQKLDRIYKQQARKI